MFCLPQRMASLKFPTSLRKSAIILSTVLKTNKNTVFIYFFLSCLMYVKPLASDLQHV